MDGKDETDDFPHIKNGVVVVIMTYKTNPETDDTSRVINPTFYTK